MVKAEVPQGRQENLSRFKPITVLEVIKPEYNSRGLKLSTPDKIRFSLWTDAVLTGKEGFSGRLIIDSGQLSEGNKSLSVKIEPCSETDEKSIRNFHHKVENAMTSYSAYKHPGTGVPDNTDYSINHLEMFKRFYLGMDGKPPERK